MEDKRPVPTSIKETVITDNRPYPTTCVDNDKVEHLVTEGKVYIVFEESAWLLLIETNQGTKEWLDQSRFNPNGMVTVHE